MKQELGPLQKQWIAELRSGKHKQGRNKLCSTEHEYCCLGVAAKFVLHQEEEESDGGAYICLNGSSYFLGDYEKIGLHSYNGAPITDYANDLRQLTILNDDAGYTFSQIADVLEEHPEAYFTGPK